MKVYEKKNCNCITQTANNLVNVDNNIVLVQKADCPGVYLMTLV